MNDFLQNLPDINFAIKDPTTIQNEVISRFEEKLGRKLHPGDPWRQVLLGFVYYLSMQRANIDFTGRQNLLKYSTDGFIQNIGALLGVRQLQAAAAVTTLEFTLSTTLPSNFIIPKGTRATPGNDIHFATNEDVEVIAGQLTAAVNATCTQVGEIGNGFEVGRVNRLTDVFPFSQGVQNTTITQGGADTESIESLRNRIQLAPESFSTAGPDGAYEFWAKSVSQLIIDVSVETPSPGEVEVVPLLQGGEIPDQSMLDAVYAECTPRTRRPLTDLVHVRPPEAVYYPLKLTYFISRRDSAASLNIQQRVNQAIESYILWQKSKLGRSITPSTLVEMVKQAGASRIPLDDDMLYPKFQRLRHYEIGVADVEDMSITYGGLE